MAPELNFSNSNQFYLPNTPTPKLHGALVQMLMEFWSTYFATPKPSFMNLLVELIVNYPPMPLVSGKIVSFLLFPPLATSFPPDRTPLESRCRGIPHC
jgi:hypothetical protein